jgi:hypothetical protein
MSKHIITAIMKSLRCAKEQAILQKVNANNIPKVSNGCLKATQYQNINSPNKSARYSLQQMASQSSTNHEAVITSLLQREIKRKADRSPQL